MEKATPIQLELFELNDYGVSSGRGDNSNSRLRAPEVRGYQKVIINIVAVIFISLASYSLGVEKGKKAATLPMQEQDHPGVSLHQEIKAQSTLKPQVNTQISPKAIAVADASGARASSRVALAWKQQESDRLVKVNAKPELKTAATGQNEKGKEKLKANNYTIQVASISQSKNVSKELVHLKNKGYSAFSLLKGKYTVICVGRFQLKEAAQNTFLKLRNSYPDCQLRRL